MFKLSLVMFAAWATCFATPSKAQDSERYEFDTQSKEAQLCRYPGEWEPESFQVYLGHTVRDGKKNAYYDVFQWRGPRGRVMTFVGLGSPGGPGWWFGKLNGKAAAGYNLNRNHHVFSTTDTQVEFECWDKGWNEREDR
ncbi:hypothetical protein [Sphingomonas koreensis]